MTEYKKDHPLSWVETNTSSVIGEVKKREQSQDVSKQPTSLVNHKNRNSSERENTYDAMDEEQNGYYHS